MFKLALCQMAGSRLKTVPEHKAEAQQKAAKMIAEAAENGADIVCLPEIWNSPYSNKAFPAYKEPEGGETWQLMSDLARENNIYLIGGSIPEDCDAKIYNTCFIFDRNGCQIAKHRKVHLFDVDLKGGQRIYESLTLSPGDSTTVFDTEFGRIGVIICFDIRFADFVRKEVVEEGADMIIMPASFNIVTGRSHWDLTIRARALDNQIFVAGCAPARCDEASFVSFSHSAVSGPWGDFKAHAGVEETILYCDIDFDENLEVRRQLPILKGRRPELY